jgi:hypothetical protein
MANLFEDPKTRALPPRAPLPPDSTGNRWAYDWRGRPVNLWRLRPGEDGR